MSPDRKKYARSIILLLLTLPLCSCKGITSNPSYFPFLFPNGDIVQTHAKPIGPGYHANFDPHACTLVVRPQNQTSPVRKHLVLLATVYDEKGQPRRGRRVEWMVEGAGHIVEVDESGLAPGRGYKVDNRYAVSYTDLKKHRITRGNDDPSDDILISPGQSWCVITSALEGDTHVTVYAPGINNWKKSKVHITHHWVNALWEIPPAVTCRAGSRKTLTTRIFRPNDKEPLSGYRVRYRILDGGPNAVFVKGQSKEKIVISDLDGKATVQLAELSSRAGSTRVGVEIIRAPDPTTTSGSGIILGRAESRIDWLAPELELKINGPATTPVGKNIDYTITVDNSGRVETKPLEVRGAIPAGCQVVVTDPPAKVQNNQLVWQLASLPGERAQDLKVTLRTSRPGQIQPKVVLLDKENQPIQRAISTEITQSDLRVKIDGPKNGAVGAPVQYQIVVSNPGTAPVDNIVLKTNFDAGLEHSSGLHELLLELDRPMGAGQSRAFPLTLTPRQGGIFHINVEAKAEGDLTARDRTKVDIRYAQLQLRMDGPKIRYIDRPADWKLTVTNAGRVPLQNVKIRTTLAPELSYVEASDRGSLSGNEVQWQLGTLKVGEKKTVSLITNCVKVATEVRQRALVTAEPSLQESGSNVLRVSGSSLEAESEAILEIRGAPAFRLQIRDKEDPVQVSGKTAYRVDVINQGSLPGNQVQVVAVVPPQMRIIRATGPAAHQITGQTVTFTPADGLLPNQTWSYIIDVEARAAGDARFKAELRIQELTQPVRGEQSTTIFDPRATVLPRP